MQTVKKRRKEWDDGMIFLAYDLAKEGTREKDMARILGIGFSTYLKWERKRPLFKEALLQGRRIWRAKRGKELRGHSQRLEEYIFNRLMPEEQKVWRRIQRANRAKTGIQTINAILEGRGEVFRQHLFFHAFVHNMFSLTKTCRMVGVSAKTWNRWRNEPEFQRLFMAVQEAKKDLAERSLINLLRKEEPSVVIHTAKTLLRDRGYGEKVEVDVNVSGQVNHNLVQIDVEKLPLEVQKLLLEEVRKVKQVESTTVAARPLLPAPPKKKDYRTPGMLAQAEKMKQHLPIKKWTDPVYIESD